MKSQIKGLNLFWWIFFSGLIILPLFYWPKAVIPFEIPKVEFLCRWIELLAVVALLTRLPNPRNQEIKKKLVFSIGLYLVAVIISSLLGSDLLKSFWGNYYRHDGLLTLFHLIGLFLLLAVYWQKKYLKLIFLALSIGSWLTSVYTVHLGCRFHLLNDLTIYHFEKAIGGPFGQPNFLAGYLLICLPLTGFFLKSGSGKKGKIFWLMVLIFQIMAISLTLSRAGMIGVIIYVLYLILFDKKNIRPLLVLLTIIIFFLVSGLIINKETKLIYQPESRIRILIKGGQGFLKRPVLGYGLANFDYAFEAIDYPVKVDNDIYVDKAHSSLLEALTTTGLLGFITYILIIIFCFLELRKKYLTADEKEKEERKTLVLVFLLFLIHSQTNILSINEELIFWLILGITASGSKSCLSRRSDLN